MNVLAVIIACGKEEELSPGVDTAFLSLGNRPVLAHSLQALQASAVVDGIVMVVSASRMEAAMKVATRFGVTKVKGVVAGGATWGASLKALTAKISEWPPIIVLHESSRPFISLPVLAESVKAAKRHGCAIAAHRIRSALKSAPKGLKVVATAERNSHWVAQSPQVFRSDVFAQIFSQQDRVVRIRDDVSEWAESLAEVHLVEAGNRNFKIRTADDLALATALHNTMPN